MKKFVANLVTCLVPVKEWRRKIRAAILRDRFSELNARLDGISSRFPGLETRIDGISSRFPGLEKRLDAIEQENKFRWHAFVWNVPGEEDWKSYLITHDMPEVIRALKEGLDEQSHEIIGQKVEHVLHLPLLDSAYDKHFRADSEWEIYCSERDREERARCLRDMPNLIERYRGNYTHGHLNDSQYRPHESFYYHHGLVFLDKETLEYLKGKALVDIGALNGDSAIALSEYGFSKTYMFDLTKSSEKSILDNVRANGLDFAKYAFYNVAFSDKMGEVFVEKDLPINGGTNMHRLNNRRKLMREVDRVPVSTVDDFFAETTEKIGMIKIDTEGEEFPIIKGAVKTIREHRPILSIAIYHCPSQFFELKPFLEKIVKGYKFMIRKLEYVNHFHFNETTLICLPEEISI